MPHPLRSLAARITLLVFAATVVSSAAVSWIAVESLDRFLRGKIDQRFPQVARRLVEDLDHWYALRSKELEVFAASAILTESSHRLAGDDRDAARARREVEQYLGYVLESFEPFERLALSSPDGGLLISVGEGAPLSETVLVEPSAGIDATRIGPALRLGEDLYQVVSTPIRTGSGALVARLHAVIGLSRLQPILRTEELGDTATVFLVDEAQRFLMPPHGLDPDTPFSGAEAKPNETGRSVAYYDDARGERVIGTRLPFPRFDWTLVIEQPYDEAFAPVVGSMSRVAGLNLAIVVVVGLIAFRIAGSIVKPLRALSDAAQRLSRGEREVVIDEAPHSSEEVNLLTRTFNEMSLGLGRSARELEENHRAIEAANAELVAKNEELSNVNLVLEQLSITDGLTKLHNHRYFQEALAQECKRATRTEEPLCLILFDIDHFKRWNDRLGHAGGDQILRRMAEVLNEGVRDTDVLARYGGEEFALLAIDTDLEGARALGEKIRLTVEQTEFVTDVPSEREPVTVSVGVAILEGEDRRKLFADADAALYAAKHGGRNHVVVAGEPDPKAKKAKQKPQGKK